MKEEHVIAILERGPFGQLSESELSEVRNHAGRCDRCRRDYEAARVSSAMLRERAAAPDFEPPPFIQTRVLSALRERRAAEQAWALPRLWKTAGALFASMVATVAALGALTFLAPGATQPDSPDDAAAAAAEVVYAEEESVLAQGDAAGEEMSYEQVLNVLYETEDEGSAR
jgi:anti-sigma factor RsiW